MRHTFIVTYGIGKAITAVGRIAAWRVAHGYLRDSENEILSSFAASDEPFQPEDRGLVVTGIKAGMYNNLSHLSGSLSFT